MGHFSIVVVGTQLIFGVEDAPIPAVGDLVQIEGGAGVVRWRTFAYGTKHGTVITVAIEPVDDEERWPDEWRRSWTAARRGRGWAAHAAP